jgi:hypothetical protein
MMKINRIRLSVLFILFSGIGFSQSNIPCDATLWQHIYHDYRLKVIEQCKTVTGVVESKKKEKDGDWHIRLRLDAGQENLLNEKNMSGQHGCLVIEVICACEVSQSDAIGSCENYINNVKVPEIGEHVSVTGSYVLDADHGWNEIHPITKILILGATEERHQSTTTAQPINNVQSGNAAYMCSGSSEVYHTNPNCTGLARCLHNVIKTSTDSAVVYYHRRLCKICGR